jgi:GST-like protein
LRAAIGLCEAEIPFTIRQVALSQGEHRGEAFRELNPAGKVPVLTGVELAGGTGSLTQSNAILFYADQARPGRLLPTGGIARARAVERFFYFVTDVIGLNGAAFALQRQREAAGAKILIEGSVEAIVRAERFLDEGPFIGGESFSLADIVAFTIIKASSNHLPWPDLPLLQAWLDLVGQRPAVQRGWTMFD